MDFIFRIMALVGFIGTVIIAIALFFGIIWLIGYNFERGRQAFLEEKDEEDDNDIEDSEEDEI